MRYDAFISYRHFEWDSYVAKLLHKKLEGFSLPRSARNMSESAKTKIERIFRDEEELPLSENLSEPINNALANSDFLICICTPSYLESKWCMREIEMFLQTHDRDHILVVLAEGEPEESFPDLLTQDGREPLAADTRGETKKEILSKIDTAVLRISAAIFGLNFDELRQRHREARLKHLVAVGGAIGTAVLAFAVFATVTLIRISNQNAEIFEQNREISKQKDTISVQYSDLQEKYAEKVVESAKQTLGKGRRDDAISELKSVLPDEKGKLYNVDVMRLLYEAMGIYGIDDELVPLQVFEDDTEINSFDVSADGKNILLIGNTKIRVYDSGSKEMLNEIDRHSSDADSMFDAGFCGADGLIVIDGPTRMYYPARGDGDADKAVALPDEISEYTSYYQDSDSETTIVCGADSLLAIGDKGEVKYRIDLGDIFKMGDPEITGVSFEKNLATATFKGDKHIYVLVFDKTSGKPVYHHSEKKDGFVAATVFANTLCYVFSENHEQGDGVKTEVVAVDIRSGKKKWKTELHAQTIDRVCYEKDYIFIIGGSFVASLSSSGEIASIFYTETPIETSWTMTTPMDEGGLYFLCRSGKLYLCDGDITEDCSEKMFQYIPIQETNIAKSGGNALYYQPIYEDYVVRYAPEISDFAKRIEDEYTETDYYADTDLFENTEKTIESVEGIDQEMVDQAFFSDDKKYLCVHGKKEIYIVDVKNHQVTKTIETVEDECEGIRYSELTKSYIIDFRQESFILDSDFNIVCRLDRIVDEENDGFIVRNKNYVYFRVPYVSYDELFDIVSDS